MIRILIADDHAIVRAGLKAFIADQPDMEVVFEASTGADAIAAIRGQDFDVVLLDISMPNKNGIDTLRSLRSLRPTLPIVILSVYVVRGRIYVSAALEQLLASRLSGEVQPAPHVGLSEREFQIFCKLAEGLPVSKIADELNLSVKTVSTYRARVLEKMTMRSNAEVTHYAIKIGLIR